MTIRDACTALLARGSKPTVPEVLPLVQAYYRKPGNGAGGSLHIVLDDGNLEATHVAYCREDAAREGDEDGAALAAVLERMTWSQRSRIYRSPEKR